MAKKKKNRSQIDKKRFLRKTDHLTRPPRLEGVVKNAKMNPVRKKKRSVLLASDKLLLE